MTLRIVSRIKREPYSYLSRCEKYMSVLHAPNIEVTIDIYLSQGNGKRSNKPTRGKKLGNNQEKVQELVMLGKCISIPSHPSYSMETIYLVYVLVLE